MRITEKRAERHCDRQHAVRENCRYLDNDSGWVPVKAGWDAFAFKEEGRTLKITCDGSSWLFEWLSNARVSAKLGFHSGFRWAAVKAMDELKTKLKHPLRYYKFIDHDDHSRGVFGIILACFIWADCNGLDWRNTSMDILLAQFQRFRGHFRGSYPKQRVVCSGVPVFADFPTAKMFEAIAGEVAEIHFLETARDFVPDINLPERGILARLFKGRRLYHLKHKKYNLGTVRGMIDHKIEAYRQSIQKAPPEMWGDED